MLSSVLRCQPPDTNGYRGILNAGRDEPLGYTTVLKLLQIMTEKGLVMRDESDRTHVYRPAVPEEKTKGALVRDLVGRVFDGSARALVTQALGSGKISTDAPAEGTGWPRGWNVSLPKPVESKAIVLPASAPDTGRWSLWQSFWTEWLRAWMVRIWALGVVGVATWRLAGWVRLRRWQTGATHLDDPRVHGLPVRLGVRRPVRVLVTAQPLAPMLLDGLKPVILIPASVLSGLAPSQVESLLAHELAHLRRRDDWALWMQTAVETLLFFHPAVWWVDGVLRREREFAADDLAVAALSDRTTYVLAMARMAELCAGRGAPSLGATTGGPMITRLRRLLNRPTPPTRLAGGASGAAASKWCAVDLSYPGNPGFKLFGYVDRSTPAGQRLMEKLGYSAVDSPTGGDCE